MNAASNNSVILHASALTKSFGRPPARVDVLHGADLTVRAGEFVAVMGESGCGKTTLLHILGLMSRPETGSLVIQGVDVLAAREAVRTRLRRRVLGFVFQRFNLLGVLSGYDNIALSLRVRGLADRNGRIGELLDQVGVACSASRKAGRMSIGEQQRVAVARALAHSPGLLLADEPTGSLDSANAVALLELFRQANRRDGQTIVMITHSTEAAGYADRVLHMKDGRLHDNLV